MQILVLLFGLVFSFLPLGIIGLVLFLVLRGVNKRRMQMPGQPGQPAVFSVPARILARRGGPGHDPQMAPAAPAWFFVTFEFQNGERLELPVSEADFALLVEGDYGTLTFAGQKFLGFVRDLQAQAPPPHHDGFAGPGNGFTEPGNGFTEPGNGFTEPGNGFTEPGNGFAGPGNDFPGQANGFPEQGDGLHASAPETQNRVMTLPPEE